MEWQLFKHHEFATYAGQWEQLNTSGARSPALDPAFVAALLHHFADDRCYLGILQHDAKILATTILTRTGTGRWSTFHPSQATVGLWQQTPDLPVENLASELIRALPGTALMLELVHMDPLLVTRPSSSKALTSLDYIPTASIPLNQPFDSYWAARGKNLRQNVRKQTNKLNRENVKVEFQVLDTPEEIAKGVQVYSELESAGWKAKLGTAVTPRSAQHRFYEDMLCTFNERHDGGWVFVLRYDGKPVAVDLCIKAFETCIVLKTTYDESINATSPAILLRHAYFPMLFEMEELKQLEFYGRVMDWHTKWSDDIRTMYHVNVYRNAIVQRTHSRIKALGELSRHLKPNSEEGRR